MRVCVVGYGAVGSLFAANLAQLADVEVWASDVSVAALEKARAGVYRERSFRVLPHALRYNEAAAPEAMARISNALGKGGAARGLYELEEKLGLPMRLAEIGMKEADLARAARIAVEAPYPNPRKVEYEPVLSLLRDAYEGRRPA